MELTGTERVSTKITKHEQTNDGVATIERDCSCSISAHIL